LYPLVIVGALFVLCLRKGAIKEQIVRRWVIMGVSTIIAWTLANIPIMATQWEGWSFFYAMNSERGADLGSLWYALSLAGIGVPDPAWWSRITMIMGYALLAGLIIVARRSPSAIHIAYLAVAIMCVGNLVYSPQYVLWLLPLVVLARPKVLDIVVFTSAELFYFVFIWLFLRANNLTLGISDAPWVYIVSIFVRISATVWIMARVVRDVLAPESDDIGDKPDSAEVGEVEDPEDEVLAVVSSVP